MGTGNNDKVLEYLYKDIFPKIKSFVLNNSGNTDDALDIFQDALVVLCKQIKLGKYNEKFEISGYLYVVSRNLWINKAKKDNKTISMPENMESPGESDFSELIITREKENVLKEIVKKLGQKCYKLLQHSIFYQTPTEDIIKAMGFSTANAVKTQKYKCKQKLIKILDENPGYKEVIE